MPAEVIRTRSLSKTFRGVAAVQRIDLSVDRESVYAFLGPNGAGKSTTIRMLLGLLKPTDGSVAMYGLPIERHRYEILARTGALIENPSLYPHLTGRENLEITRRILGAPRSDIARVLQIVGLERAGGSVVKTYSMGMKQRLGLAQALIGQRELLLLDEPTNGLDPGGMNEMRALIRDMPRRHGITVFLSSHLLSEVEQVATHVGILSRGQLVFQGTAEKLFTLRRSCLRIRVDRSDAAAAVLRAGGWTVNVESDSLVLEEIGAAGAMNRALIGAGHDVRHLAVETTSLEELFLSMTDAEVR